MKESLETHVREGDSVSDDNRSRGANHQYIRNEQDGFLVRESPGSKRFLSELQLPGPRHNFLFGWRAKLR
jgi:hypothetical protein